MFVNNDLQNLPFTKRTEFAIFDYLPKVGICECLQNFTRFGIDRMDKILYRARAHIPVLRIVNKTFTKK